VNTLSAWQEEVCPMKMNHEVWAEFADGSVAAYGVQADELLDLVNRLLNTGPPCKVWVDGQIWRGHNRLEDGIDLTEKIVL
jgi:hypothetical protein